MKKTIIALILIITNVGLTSSQCTILHDFSDTLNGRNPEVSLYSDGIYLYGMTSLGGYYNTGTIFKIKNDGSGFTKLLDFPTNTFGVSSRSGFISDGTYLYGMTEGGGTNNAGTIFRIKPDGTSYFKLYDFDYGEGSPIGSLLSDGTYLYGATRFNTLFKLLPDGTGFTKLHSFPNSPIGWAPSGSVIFDGTYLYGTTAFGGANGDGTLYKIKTDSSNYSTIIDFAGVTNGNEPEGSLYSDGTYLYGVTYKGGINDAGTIFKIKPDGSGFIKILDFAGAVDGANPLGSLISDGTYLYGMTQVGGTNNLGTIFKIKPDGSDFNKVLDFTGANGSGPFTVNSLLYEGGFLYGMTVSGGTNGGGVVFKISTSVGINDYHENNNIKLYPNPTNDHIVIDFSNNYSILNDYTLIVTNSLSQVIYTTKIKTQQTTIDLSTLTNKGIYFVHLIDVQGCFIDIRKIVLQ